MPKRAGGGGVIMYRWVFSVSRRGSLRLFRKSNLRPHHGATDVYPMDLTLERSKCIMEALRGSGHFRFTCKYPSICALRSSQQGQGEGRSADICSVQHDWQNMQGTRKCQAICLRKRCTR